jgi:hypothetical protein
MLYVSSGWHTACNCYPVYQLPVSVGIGAEQSHLEFSIFLAPRYGAQDTKNISKDRHTEYKVRGNKHSLYRVLRTGCQICILYWAQPCSKNESRFI